MTSLMQLPFQLSDVRMVCIDGNKVRFVLSDGHFEVVLDSRHPAYQKLPAQQSVTNRPAPNHTLFDDGIFGI